MKLDVFALSDVGLKRNNNQDSYLIDESLGLYIVADGMGGHKGGEVASALAVQTVQDVVKQSYENDRGMNPEDLLRKAYLEASQRIYDKSEKEPALKGMGTTMVVALHRDETLYVGNVGDSRCYLFTQTGLWQITEDHSLLAEQLRAGLVREDQIDKFSGKNVITRSVGYERDIQCDTIRRTLAPNDKFVICSDGLSGMVSDTRLYDIFMSVPSEKLVQRFVQEAKWNGGDDNVTALVLHAREEKQ